MTIQQKKPKISMKQIEKIIAEYKGKKWALIPLAQEIQEKAGGAGLADERIQSMEMV